MTALPYPPPYQDLRTLAEHVCLGESTIERLVKDGMFPRPRMIRGKRLWRWKEVDQYLANSSETVAQSIGTAEGIRDATRRLASG